MSTSTSAGHHSPFAGIDTEWQNRYDKKFSRFLKQVKLRYPTADLDESTYDPGRMLDTASIERLNTCHWIEKRRNLLITGLTSSGKKYLSNALCISAILNNPGGFEPPVRSK